MNEKIIKKLIFVNLFLCFSTFAKEYFVQVFPVTLHENKIKILLGKDRREPFWKALGSQIINPGWKTAAANDNLQGYTEYYDKFKVKISDDMLWMILKENDSETYIYLVPVVFQDTKLLRKEGVFINQLSWVTLDEIEEGKFGPQDEKTIDEALVEFVKENKSAISDKLKEVVLKLPKPISLKDLANNLSQLHSDLLELNKKLNLLGG